MRRWPVCFERRCRHIFEAFEHIGNILIHLAGGGGAGVDERGASGNVEISTEHGTFRFQTGRNFQCVVYRKTGRGIAVDNIEGRCRPFVLVPAGEGFHHSGRGIDGKVSKVCVE